jgi:D12 class N6 adenine-specific DNA methyltransferase
MPSSPDPLIKNPAPRASLLPLIRWAGSKRKLIPLLKSRAPEGYRRYLEPFAGSACFYFDMQPDVAFLNDLNSELISTYRSIAANPKQVFGHLKEIPRGSRAYYRIRAQEGSSLDAAEKAARFIYLIAPYLDRTNVSFVSLGPKPHVLATILVAMRFSNITCLHVQGNSKQRADVKPHGAVCVTKVMLASK